jgi:hypothetical protein
LLDPSIAKLAKDIKYVAKKLTAEESDQTLKIVPDLANYSVTALMLTLIGDQEPSIATYNEVIGILETVKMEFWDVYVAPYERQKCFENGPILPLDIEISTETIN